MTTLIADAAYTESRIVPFRYRLAWGPILMGAVCAIGIQFILTILGIAIGVSAAPLATANQLAEPAVETMSISAAIWWLVTGTASLFIGGMVYGRLAGLPRGTPLMLEAMAMWAVVAVFGFVVLWTGMGMAASVSSPLSAVNQVPRLSMNPIVAPSDSFDATDVANTDAATEQRATRALRVASWWSVVGLLAGVAASVVGAMTGAPSVWREPTRA